MFHGEQCAKDVVMDIEGTFTLQASLQDVWHDLTDTQVLQKTLPGVEQLEQQGEQHYALLLHIRHGVLAGRYHALITPTQQSYPSSYSFIIEDQQPGLRHNKIGGSDQEQPRDNQVTGNGLIHLKERGSNTIVSYQGRLYVNTADSSLSPSLAKGAIKLLIQQFFTALADRLRVASQAQLSGAASNGAHDLHRRGNAAEQSEDLQSSRLQMLVHRLRLGGGDPTQEAQWVARMRRVGTVSALLLLVWVGTRIPRK